MSIEEYNALADALIEAAEYKKTHKREFAPEFYPWQLKACNEAVRKQIMLMASNRSGKTMSAGYIAACHLTGDYPAWWEGYRYDGGIRGVALGVDNTQLKDVVQLELFGDVYQDERNSEKKFTGGWVHPEEIKSIEWSPQTPGLARRVHVKGKRGDSTIALRAYTQSKTGQATLSFAGTSLDFIWVDECPPDDLVGQLITRTMTGDRGRGGRILYTMTPELGVTKLVSSFMDEPGPNQLLVGPIPWDDCPHLTPEVQAEMLASLPEHEHDMRSKGIPFFGSGLIYPIAEERISCEPFLMNTKPWIRGIKAMDIGTTHPTAIVWCAYDPEDDTIYVVKTYKQQGEAAAYHAQQANSMWPQVPTVFPHDIDKTEPGSGRTARRYYADAGLTNTLDFKNPDGTNFVEPGILDLYERMKTGRFKVFSHCEDFWQEFRMYHRKDGKIHKEFDDIMDATRYAAVMAPNWASNLSDFHRRVPRVTGKSARIS